MKTITRVVINIMLTCFVLNINAGAMNNPIYSYTVEDEGLNLWEATIPEGTETLEIPAEIGGEPVISISDSFLVKQVDIHGDIFANPVSKYMDTNHIAVFSLKNIVFPESIKRISGNMIKEFSGEKSVLNLKFPQSAVITDNANPNIYLYYGDMYNFYLRYGDDAPEEEQSLSEIGIPIDLYVDGTFVDGCVLYNGISYVPFDSDIIGTHDYLASEVETDCPPYSIWNSAHSINHRGKLLKIIECKLKTPEKFLDENSAYTSKENAKYEMTGKQIIFNARTDKVTTIEIYRSVDENEKMPSYATEIIGVSGGEVTIESIPVYEGYVPVRMVCEAAQRKVDWDGETNTVYVTTPKE